MMLPSASLVSASLLFASSVIAAPVHRSVSDNVEEFVAGGVDSVSDAAKGGLHAALHPIETAKGAAYATAHLPTTLQVVGERAKKSFEANPARAMGYTVGTVGMLTYPFADIVGNTAPAKYIGDMASKATTGTGQMINKGLGVFGSGEQAVAAGNTVANVAAEGAPIAAEGASVAAEGSVAAAAGKSASEAASRRPFLHHVGDAGRAVGRGLSTAGSYAWAPFKLAGNGVSNAYRAVKGATRTAASATGRFAVNMAERIPGKPYSNFVRPYLMTPTRNGWNYLTNHGIHRGLASGAVIPLQRNGAQLEYA